ncbi:MAG: acyltransferase [Erysipelotrichaceae bacterium]
MEKKQFVGLDIMKYISAIFVVAIHTAPFIEINETFNVLIVSLIARIAVPFYFVCSSFLFFRKIDFSKGWWDEDNLAHYKKYVFHLLKLYLIWCLLYFVFNISMWIQGGFNIMSLVRYVRDLFFTGGFYHLWFLPALVVGTSIVYFLHTYMRPAMMFLITFILYIIGMLFNLYGTAMNDIPLINTIFHLYQTIFVTTRNGVFFAPIFIVIGANMPLIQRRINGKKAIIPIFVFAILLIIEGMSLYFNHMLNDLSCMYLSLLPFILYFFTWLLSLDLQSYFNDVAMRSQSILIYVSHIAVSLIIKGLSDLCGVYIGNFGWFILTLIGSMLLARFIYFMSLKPNGKILKNLY